MKKFHSISAITRMLNSPRLLTKEGVADALRISPASARNALMRWEDEGLVTKISTGGYVSTVNAKPKFIAVEQAIVNHIAVKDAALIGASCWQKAGWCDCDVVHIAFPLPASRVVPDIIGAKLHRLNAGEFGFLKKKTEMAPGEIIASLNPVSMMLWWMDADCDVMMPSPNRIHWEKVSQDDDLRYAVRKYWPQMSGIKDLVVRDLYEMIYMDRWDGTTSGVTEDPAPHGAKRVPFKYEGPPSTEDAKELSMDEDHEQTPGR